MGNNHSQIIDDDDSVPRYNYHESVLRDAQTESFSSHLTHTDDVDNGDEYHSAEEDDSDQNSTDNSQDSENNIVDDVRSESHEQQNVMLRLNSQMPAAEELGFTNSPSDLNPTQPLNDHSSGRLKQNEHLNRAIRSRRARSTGRTKDAESNPNPGLNSRKVTTHEDLMTNTSSSCQFTAVSPSCVVQTAPDESRDSGPSLGKRKTLPDSPVETVLPRKKTLIRNSSKRKWLGLSSSSESDLSETEEEVKRKSYKKRKITTQSPKKSRRFDRYSRSSDSDERRYEKHKCRRQTRQCCGCKSYRNDDEESNHDCIQKNRHHKSNISNHSKRKRRYDGDDDEDDESSDFSDNTSRYEKRHKCKKHENNEDKNEEERDKVQSRRHYRNVNKNDDHKNSHIDITCSRGCQTQVSMLIQGDDQNETVTNRQTGNIGNATVDLNTLSTPCHTFKMGNQSFRNSLGKVFPLKYPHMENTGTAPSDAWGNMAPKSDNQDLLGVSNLRHSSTTKSSPLQNNLTEENLFDTISVRIDKDTERSHVQTNCSSQYSVQTNLQESPFKNVVLTPSISNTNLACLHQPTMLKNLAGDIGDDNISDMEIEQSDIQFGHSRFTTASSLQSSHQTKNTAAKFRRYWLEKKKNISQNLKSLFSRKNLALKKQPASPMWQTFSGTHAQSAWKSSLGRAAESTSSFFGSPSVTSPLISQMSSLQCHPEKFHGNFLSSSTQSHATPQLTDVTSASKMFPGVFASADVPSQPVSSPVNSSLKWLPPDGQNQVLNCHLAGVINMSVTAGQLVDQKTAGIVNWTDTGLTHTVTSCSRDVATAAGPLMQAACNDYIGTQGRNLEAPDVLTTPAGGGFDSSVQAILHVVEPVKCGGEEDSSHALTEVFANCLRFAKTHLRLQSISCPLIGDGTFPFITCVQSFLEAVLALLSELPSDSDGIFRIQLIIRDPASAKMAGNFIKSYLECVFCENSHDQAPNALTGDNQHMKHLGFTRRTNLSREACQTGRRFTVERTDSGRPRLKRPRL